MSLEFKQVETSPYIQGSWQYGKERTADWELSEKDTLEKLRRISRRLIKQNLIAAGLQQAYTNMVVGGRVTVTTKSNNDYDKLLFKELRRVDDNQQTLTAFLAEIVNAAFMDGDVLVYQYFDKQTNRPLFGLVEASRIRTPSDLRTEENIRLGIKYKGKKMVGAYVRSLSVNPSALTKFTDTSEDYQYIPFYSKSGKRTAYLFSAPVNKRPDQTRMYPLLTPSFNMLRYIDSLLEYTLVGTMVAASFSVFIRSKNPAGTKKSIESQNKNPALKSVGQLSPGQIWYLNGASEAIEFASPNKPSDNTDQMLRRLYRTVSMQLRMPYETAFLDLSEANYSSFKSGMIEVRRNKERWDDGLRPIITWIANNYLEWNWANGWVKDIPNSIDLSVNFPKLGVIDEEKEARANRMDITDTKVKSRRIAINEAGYEFDTIQDQLTEEALIETERQAQILVKQKELEEQYGIVFDPTKQDANSTDVSQSGDTVDAKDSRKDAGNW